MILTLILAAGLAQSALGVLPMGWKACKASSSDYNKCLGQQIEKAVASLAKGNKKLHISAVDPLVFKMLSINQSNGPVSIKLDLKDFAFKGLSSTKVFETTNDWKTLNIKIFNKEVRTDGIYKINGKVLILPIVGSGKCSFTWYNMTTENRISFKEVDIKGKKHFEVTQYYLDMKPQKVKMHFDNLFNGDKALGDNMNLFLNENWEEIINEVKPAITKGLSMGFVQITNQVFSKIPKDELDVK